MLADKTIKSINIVLSKKDIMNDTLQRNIEAALIGVGGVPLDGIDVRFEER